MTAPVMRKVEPPKPIQVVQKPTMIKSASGDVGEGNMGTKTVTMNPKKNMMTMNKLPKTPSKSATFFTNDTLLMDTTPGMSKEDKKRRKSKDSMLSQSMPGSNDLYSA